MIIDLLGHLKLNEPPILHGSGLVRSQDVHGLALRKRPRGADERNLAGARGGVGELMQKIDAYVASYNLHRRPFVWTATADSILAKLQRLCNVI